MKELGPIFLIGVCDGDSIHTKDFSIRLTESFPKIDKDYVFIGKAYMDLLGIPYMKVESFYELVDNPNDDLINFISLAIHPTDKNQIQRIELHNNLIVWVDFRFINDIQSKVYHCGLEYRLGIWYLVPKGGDNN